MIVQETQGFRSRCGYSFPNSPFDLILIYGIPILLPPTASLILIYLLTDLLNHCHLQIHRIYI